MTTLAKKGLAIALVHVALVASLGAKLLVDRSTRPRVWARVVPYDPNLPIRGRYVSLRVEVMPVNGLVLPEPETRKMPDGSTFTLAPTYQPVKLLVKDGALAAEPGEEWKDLQAVRTGRAGSFVIALQTPLAYFIPEGVADPSRRPADEELWVEVTVPRTGLPRPIQLGVKKNGVITPLGPR